MKARDIIIIELLRDKNLTYLIDPFRRMVELNKLNKINIHLMTWKVIMRYVHNIRENGGNRKDLEKFIVSYLVLYGILFIPARKVKKVKSTVGKDRVKKHRAIKKELGYKTISIQLSPDNYERMKRYKMRNNLTYNDLIDKLLNGKNSLKY